METSFYALTLSVKKNATERVYSQSLDLGVLQETNITDGVYTRGSAGYSVIATDKPSQHLG